MWSDWKNGTFALPPGADFCRGVVDGLIGRVQGKPPEAMAAITIYVNAARTLNTLRTAFDAHAAQNGPLLLPKLRLISDLGAALPGERAAPLARVLDLGNLVSRLIERDPVLGAGQSVPELAQSLSELMGEMQSEGCDATSLDQIDIREHAAHWQRSLQFLHIAAGFYLSDPPVDTASRQRRRAEALAQAWQDGRDLPQNPVLVVGSTGSHGATRLFLRAVAGLPLGAVILPGYDFHQPDRVWDHLGAGDDDHPQARLAALRGEGVMPWTDAPQNEVNKLISLALRPAPVTDQWISEGPHLPEISALTKNMTLIEADQPQEEADAIAVLIRDAVGRGQPVRLFAADRGLVRRVGAALDRWDLSLDDSAGEPLHLSGPGLFLRHVAGLFGQRLSIDTLLALLKNQITATGSSHGDSLRHTRDLELRLRSHGPAFPDGETLRDWGSRGDESRKIWASWLSYALDIVTTAADDVTNRPVTDRLADHLHLAEWMAAGPGGDALQSRLWDDAAGHAAKAAMSYLADHAGRAQAMGPRDYGDLIDTQLSAQAVRARDRGHPLIRACGPREARTEVNLSDNAIVILAGLNEGGWPQSLPPDPWLSRDMRRQAGLTVPERQVGLSAHDFQQAIAAPEVVMTRARRDADAETIPSRWLNRLTNLVSGLPDQGGPQALDAMRMRGGRWLALARQLVQPRFKLDPAPRPAPVPPAPAFDNISVTQVSKLIRDPYSIYASKVLRLRPLDPLRPEPDASLRGQVLHKVAERLLSPPPSPDTPPAVLAERFLQATRDVLAQEVPWPAARAFWQARMDRIATQIAKDEANRLQNGRPLVVESTHSLPVPGLNLRLTAKPDRIDRLAGGEAAHVYDYKSGRPPNDREIEHFDKQLLLEAAMVAKGAFPTLGPVEVEGISYIQLGAEGETHPRKFTADAAEETWQKFVILASHYLRGERGFTARRALQKTTDAGDYDHLSRYGEWGDGDLPVKMRVGGDG
ncbi:double-strand break repair protein AddB [Paracoccus aurantiacus]|uniref:Double-strand break repair protein AddB n=1 Tax=Paracoccus aurantiacus TaxID=2599412 RepID=A0A5C6RYW3_9RHOB|nr:double-strand break repair protein AddB [Paracoccus aurantiacus]TXB67806.1 double-strand break repair protein AddB [Paracoccus aurantiacus]